MKELSPVTPFKGPSDEGGATSGHADEFNQRQIELMKRDEEIRAVLSSQAQQTAQLKHGQNIVEADQSSVTDVLIEGRTMVNLVPPVTSSMVSDGSFDTGFSKYGKSIKVQSREVNSRVSVEVNTPSVNGKYIVLLDCFIVSNKGTLSPSITLAKGRSYHADHIFLRGQGVTQENTWVTTAAIFDTNELEGEKSISVIFGRYHQNSSYEGYIDGLRIYKINDQDYQEALSLSDFELSTKYPYIEGIRHVKNPLITKRGKNLLPPFYEWSGNTSVATIHSPYELELYPTGNAQSMRYKVEVPMHTDVTISIPDALDNDEGRIFVGPNPSGHVEWIGILLNHYTKATFNTGPNSFLYVVAHTRVRDRTYNFKNIQLEIGREATPFEPQNEDYLYMQSVLGASLDGIVSDSVYKKGDNYVLRELISKNVVIDGSFSMINFESRAGERRIKAQVLSSIPNVKSGTTNVFGFNKSGVFFRNGSQNEPGNTPRIHVHGDSEGSVSIIIPNKLTGFSDDEPPTHSQIRDYFLNDPLTLYYELSTPQETNVRLEGSIGLNRGKNLLEVDSGVIVREKVIPAIGITAWHINHKAISTPSNLLKHRADKIIAVYRDGILDRTWNTMTSEAHGKQRVNCSLENYDESAEYTVTYLIEDKHYFTTNIDQASVTYQTSLKSAHDASVKQINANTSDISAINLLLGQMVKSIRILGGE